MKKELQDRLFDKYPKIFRQKDLTPQETCMCWGITCGDGWYDIIDTLCHCIQNYSDHNNLQVEACQIKSKFGGLRFYVNIHNQYISGLIAMAEAMSRNTKEWNKKEIFYNKGEEK
tara:strand:+ start:1690 stop:2034 length:345 start_codon:yes stop_codon:yes gene_type:complete